MKQVAFYHMQDSCQIKRRWRIEITEGELWFGVGVIFLIGFVIGLSSGILAMAAL